ncbi:hypothetical protein [Photobacterium damselae]|uniref:hypothetical protein n=1 Tax=Photobacterium damselae TaxID=38293 RepID=UPI00165D539A|nr:hypothetical protein [Photobacterium damselae]
MALPSSGSISMSQVAAELGIPATGLSLNDQRVRVLAGRLSGTISFSDLRGKSNAKVITISSNSGCIRLRDFVTSSDMNIILNINSGVTVQATGTGLYANGLAIELPYNPTSIVVNVYGTIRGGGDAEHRIGNGIMNDFAGTKIYVHSSGKVFGGDSRDGRTWAGDGVFGRKQTYLRNSGTVQGGVDFVFGQGNGKPTSGSVSNF